MLPTAVRSVGARPPPVTLTLLSIVADPGEVPVNDHNCVPCVPSLAEKYSVVPAAVRSCGFRPNPDAPPEVSLCVPAAVPSLSQSWKPLVAS